METPTLVYMLKSRSFQIFFLLGVYFLGESFLSAGVHQGLYAISLVIKDLLMWILPLTVFFFIAYAISSFERRAPLFILALFLFEALSNSASVWYAYGCAQLTTSFLPTLEPYSFSDTFSPLWRIPLLPPAWWSADKGTFAGIALGLIRFPALQTFFVKGKEAAEKVFVRVFSRLIPLFVLGFVARMYKTHLLQQLLDHYASLLFWLLVILAIYITLLFVLGNRNFLRSLKNLMPAAGVAISSGSSLSTLPWTISGTAKNLQNPELAKAVLPATTNIQQIGDCIANSFLCFLIYTHFNGHAPSLALWIPFSLVFVLARFATAATLGGAIFIMLPIYEAYLGFTPEMTALILAFNVLCDPLITCANVLANGALCRIFEKIWTFALPNAQVKL